MKLKTLLASVGIGAALMYFLDPQQGNRRRALVRDRVNGLINDLDETLDTIVQDTRNRARGVLSEMTAKLSDQGAPDWILEERVRTALGRIAAHARGIEVRSDGGHIYLTGPVLKDEKDEILKAVVRTRGIRSVEDELQVFENARDIPSLQGEAAPRRQPQPDWQQQNWSPATRLISGVGGSLLTLYGLKRKGLTKPLLSTAGLLLTTRSVTNKDTKTLLGLGTGENGFRIRKAVNIDAPVDEVYQFWRNIENFKLFMEHVQEISVHDGISTWKVAGPAGTAIEFQSQITNDIPNELVSWETLPDSQVKHAGFVRFNENRDGSTRVSVQMEYLPPAGAVGHAVAQLFGVDPRQAMNEDLIRLKSLLEAGRTSTSTGTATLNEEGDVE